MKKLTFATTISQSDVADGWRDKRHDGGCVIDIDSNEIIVSGLSMPHSPDGNWGKKRRNSTHGVSWHGPKSPAP